MTTTAQAYRSASLEHASHLDLLLATYDVLAQDLRLAGAAASNSNIAERCRLSGHALTLLGHLESWTTLLAEPALEISLAQFYRFVRAQIMSNQNADGPHCFTDLALFVCEVRAAWHGRGTQAHSAPPTVLDKSADYSPQARVSFSCSA